MNQVQLIGRLGKDPESKQVNEKTVTSINLAVTRSKEHTDWINVTIWGKAAETVAKYVKKGDQLGVVGSLSVRSYEKDGVKKWITEVISYNVTLYSKSNNSESSNDLPF